MPLFSDEAILDQFISDQRNAIKYRLYFAFCILVLGIGVIVIGFLLKGDFAREEGINTIIKICGVFVSSLSGFPLKRIIVRKEKISVFKILRQKLQKIEEEDKEYTNEEKAKLEEMIRNIIEKTALG